MTPFCNVWTPEEDARLRDLICSGLTNDEIALELGRTENAVRNRRERVDVDPREIIAWSSEALLEAMLDAQVRFANRGGMTLKEAQAVLMGGNYAPPIPGTERIYKTCDTQRLAA